jgi:fused signal recognition particle receptor
LEARGAARDVLPVFWASSADDSGRAADYYWTALEKARPAKPCSGSRLWPASPLGSRASMLIALIIAALIATFGSVAFFLRREAPKLSPKPNKRTPASEAPKHDQASTTEHAASSTKTRDRETAPKDIAFLTKGLSATRTGLMARLATLLSGKKTIDPAMVAELEEILLTSDVGPKTTQILLARLQERLPPNALVEPDAIWQALKDEALKVLARMPPKPLMTTHQPTVVLMVGVNGAGKTTTIGKLATHFVGTGKKVMLGAGDTFRAAAVQQLEVWGERVKAEVFSGKEGADPGAVAFEATTKARTLGIDLLMIDTAGRLHNKAPLMDEIRKVRKTIQKALPDAPHETLLVLDATTGQNALNQAALFKEAIPLTGIILTKLDGTAKGGMVLAIAEELDLPVRYIGLGERAEDLRVFDPVDFINALFAR